MGWLKNILQGKRNEEVPPNYSESSNGPEAMNDDERVLTVKQYSKFIGIDFDFINAMYFINDSEKAKHLSNLQFAIDTLNIKTNDDWTEAYKKLVDYNYSGSESIDFLNLSFLSDSYTITSITQNGHTIEKEGDHKIIKGVDKINSFYDAFSFASFNINRKLDAGYFDFNFEKELIFKNLTNDFHYGREFENVLEVLLNAYQKSNQKEEIDICASNIEALIVSGLNIPYKSVCKHISTVFKELGDKENEKYWKQLSLKKH